MNQPHYWTKSYPPYLSLDGWEFEKQRALEVVKLQLRFARIERMINRADLLFKAAKDSYLMCKYNLITIRLYEASNRVAERLILDYKEPLN
jgi:hypothetical protein